MKYLKTFELHSSTYKSAADKSKRYTHYEDERYKDLMKMHDMRKRQEEGRTLSDDRKYMVIAKKLMKHPDLPSVITNWRQLEFFLKMFDKEPNPQWTDEADSFEGIYDNQEFVEFYVKNFYDHLSDIGKFNIIHDAISYNDRMDLLKWLMENKNIKQKLFKLYDDGEPGDEVTYLTSLFDPEYSTEYNNNSIIKVLDLYNNNDITDFDVENADLRYMTRSLNNHPIVTELRNRGNN
jgi:hypothetical protein